MHAEIAKNHVVFMIKHFSIRVSGKVQGVFFRASTEQKAREFSIKGFVKNEPDGSVFIEAEGEEENLKLFIEWCQQGPGSARVDRCDIKPGEVKKYSGFVIQR
jgi:acylphosphatase